ncbi:MAG TPA: hypothetical protein VH643_11440 [Gemmataceae bacterium]|jgi:uncharacterized membrane protein HdeD (DUF308 family)
MATSSTLEPRRASGRLFLLLGIAVAVLGVIAYVVQIKAQRLTAPWYVPIAATIGLLLVVVSLWRGRTVWRALVLVLLVLFAGAAWAFMLTARLPPYTGPIAVERPFPAFATERADGTPFTQQDLKGEQTSVMVFFRGRW